MHLDERLKVIYSRRSIRKFTPEPVDEEDIRQLLQVGMSAPSAHNKKPWYFVVIQRRDLLNEIASKHPYGKMLFEAPLAIAVCADPALTSMTYWTLDCSAATQNILLAATALGLGSVWLAAYPRQERVKMIRQVLGIPSNYEVLSLIAIGHPNESKPPRSQYDDSRVFYDQWENRKK